MDMTFWLSALLKATLWTGMLCIITRLVPATHPVLRRSMALLGLWALFLLPWVTPELASATWASSTLVAPSATSSGIWQAIAMGVGSIWAGGTILHWLRLILQILRSHQLITNSLPCDRASMFQNLRVRLSGEVSGPCLLGWWHPQILMPTQTLGWSQMEWQAALSHEAQHARQQEGWHRLGVAIIHGLFWFHPWVGQLRRVYELESELCCDQVASRGCGQRVYGEMLLALAVQDLPSSLRPAFAEHSGLRTRLERLFSSRNDPPQNRRLRFLAVGLLLLSTLTAVTLLRVHPTLNTAPDSGAILQNEALLRLSANPFPAP